MSTIASERTVDASTSDGRQGEGAELPSSSVVISDYFAEVHAGAHEALLASALLYRAGPPTFARYDRYKALREAIFRMLAGAVEAEAIVVEADDDGEDVA